MMVDRIGQVSHVQLESKIGRADQVRGGDRDSISLSSEAMERAEVYQVTELARAAEILDDARIAELRGKINDPSYLNEITINATAGRIMDAFGL